MKILKFLIIPLLIVILLGFGMNASAELHSKWSEGDLIFYDGTINIWAIRNGEDGVKVYDDLNLTFGDGDDATIEFDAESTSALIITCATITLAGDVDVSGAVTFDGGLGSTIVAPSAVIDAVYGLITASAEWTGNLVGVRGRVNISATGNVYSATGVWAGVAITSVYGGYGLVTGLNVEVSSTTAQCPNAIMYIQSLPGDGADFSDVPYLVFSETISGGGVGSYILFEVGHAQARTIPTKGSDELFYHDTLHIAVNEEAGVRTNFFIPLSTITGTFTTEYPIVATYGSGLDISASAIAVTITDPKINNAGEYIDGVYALINSTDAVGWTQGEVVAVRGESHLATLNPGSIVTSFGGKFTLEFDSAFTATGLGCTAGAYIGVINEYTGAAPTAVLYIEEITTGGGDARLMPMIVMTSQAGETADKSPYAFSFGFAAAGTTVGTGTGEMFEGNTIQCLINGTPMFIPFSTVEATFTTAYPIASTSTTGFLSTATFVPDETRTNYAFAVGFGHTETNELDITMGSGSNQNFDPFAMNINIIGDNPGGTSTTNLMYIRLTHDDGNKDALRLKCTDFLVEVGKHVLDAYVYQGELKLTGDVTIGGEVCGLGMVVDAGTGSVSGTISGMRLAMRGSSMPSTSYGLFMATGSSATLTYMIYMETQGGTTITNGIHFASAGTFTNALSLGAGITNFMTLSDAGNSDFVTTGGTDCAASDATDPSHTIKIIVPGGSAGYIRVWADK